MCLVARLQVGPADALPRGKSRAAGALGVSAFHASVPAHDPSPRNLDYDPRAGAEVLRSCALVGWRRRWSRSGTLGVAGVLATSPELGRVWVTGLRLWPRVFSFPFEAMEGRIGRAFGILLTSKVRLRSAGSRESLQLEQLRKGVPEAEGDTFCKLSSPLNTLLKSQRPPWRGLGA